MVPLVLGCLGHERLSGFAVSDSGACWRGSQHSCGRVGARLRLCPTSALGGCLVVVRRVWQPGPAVLATASDAGVVALRRPFSGLGSTGWSALALLVVHGG